MPGRPLDTMCSVLNGCHVKRRRDPDNVLPYWVCSLQAEKLMKQIGVKNVKLSEYEMSIAAHLVDPLSMQVSVLFQF